ncbi:hypothetical protein L21SP5_00728 [Salinivirga cyanobacteriivorans]|uniref:Ribbon-helix-helix protein CopG domain-containing protein n=1 Tax=Salinivirga cyanobacteriivorans TaxID=1307839 RepID=A0A0S2HWF9_9BACT|nr:hypothetical protein [Salinivirga cyanobacteriivorans]ALO14400.1 hypothetical protein L21SP5_00728 [Salinivirga cyanobacteriivorans]
MKARDGRRYKRKYRKSILLTDKEISAFEQYCERYKVRNQSQIIREALFKSILQHYDEDYPTLFSKQELARLEQ